ncbi:hypothetical protein J1614_010426 [Plenodomus biglobosus]|nr:hypothetical protein J1614_010426 [Plenodomus biglobosus]
MIRKHDRSVLDLFRTVCGYFPENIAVQDGSETITYRALDKRSSALAQRLGQSGAKDSQVIPLLTNSCLHMVVGILAILKIGATYTPIDRDQWPRERIEDVLQRTDARIAVYTGRDMDISGIVMINAEDIDVDGVSEDRDMVPVPELAAIIFTSGTTGKPKGVEISHSSLVNFVSAEHFNYDVTPEDRVLLILSVAFDACMGTLFNTICNGGTVLLATPSTLQHRSRQCSVLVMTPSILEALEPPQSLRDYPRLDRIILGGETASKKLITSWSVLKRPIWIAYGPTEATCATLTAVVQTCPQTGEFRPSVLGNPIDGAKVIIVDSSRCEIEAAGEEGELLISGTGLARGYWRDKQRTDEKFFLYKGERTYSTGDRARWFVNASGERVVEFCGRRDRTVKIRGFLVNLELDIDAAILAMEPNITAAYTVQVHGKLYTALIPVPLDITELKSRWRARVPPYLVPDHMVGLKSLPMTPNGKVDPRKLGEVLRANILDAQENLEGIGSLKSAIVGGMARILDIPVLTIDLNQSFVSQGLHSLAAIMLCSHCRKQEFNIPMEQVLASPSINSLLHAYDGTACTPMDVAPAREIASVAPLTALQKRLIYDSMHEKTTNVVQHIATYWRKDIQHLQRAWRTVISAEPIFRTELDINTQTQRIIDKATVPWTEFDVESVQEVEQRTTQAAAATGLGASFAILHYQGAWLPCDQSTIIFSIHHALFDGFSASLILNKVAAAIRGIPFDPSPPFTVAVDEIQQHAACTSVEASTFWKQQDQDFSDAIGDMLLPKPAAAMPDTTAEYSIQTGLSSGSLAKFSCAGRSTVATFHYAAWALVLSSYTNATTVLFGAVLSARTLGFQGAESIIGPLIATQPLRMSINRLASTDAFLQQTYDAVRSLSKFQASERKGEPLRFSSALAMQYDSPTLEPAGIEPVQPAVVVESPALPLNVLVEGDGRVRFLYRCNSFSDEHVRQIAALYRNVLHALTHPALSVDGCLKRRLDEEMSSMLLARGNASSPLSRARATGPTVTSCIEKAAQANAARVAVEKGTIQLTYAELMMRAGRVAAVAEELVKPGDVVCVVADRSINWIVGVCAALKMGAVYCPLDDSHTSEYHGELLRSSGATLMLCTQSSQLVDGPPSDGVPMLAIDTVLADASPRDAHVLTRSPSVSDAAFVCFTSGSTGKPKGVACAHSAVTAFHADLDVRLNSAPGVRIAQFLSPGFDGCVHEVFASLCYGATLVLRKEPDDPFSHLGHVDVAMMTPSVAAGLDPANFPNLKFVYFAGEPVQQPTLNKWAVNRTLYNLYGPTEGTIGSCQQKLQAHVSVNVGPPVPSMRLYILDDAMQLSPPGVVGNIFIAGVQVSRGYINLELAEQNAREFLPDLFCPPPSEGERMYRTGDLGFWDSAGNVHVCGRKDRQIKMRGFRVNLDDVGAIAMREMADLRKAIATEHKGKLVLWVEPENLDTHELAQRLRSVLPHHAQPKHIVARAQLPLSKNGKLDAKALAQQDSIFENPCTTMGPDQGLSSFEALIAREWRSLLGLDTSVKLTSKDSFIALGGHSVLQLELAARLRSAWNMPLAIRDIIRAPILADMAAVVRARMHRWNAQSKEEIAIKPLGTRALSPAELEWWHRYRDSESQSAFNVPWVAKLHPGVDLGRLARAFNAVMARHRILRSRFVPTKDGGVTRIISDEPIEAQMVHAIDTFEFVNRPYDLTNDVLARVALSPSVLAISISHIICDLTALNALLTEVSTLYNRGTLPAVQLEYFDSTAWSQPLDRETAFFWSTHLRGLQIRRDCEDHLWHKSYKGTSLLVPFPQELCQGIVDLTTTSGLTLHQFSLAATSAVLHSLCNRTDMVLGSPYMNRSSVEDQKVVGLYLQALPVRVKVENAMTSLEVLRTVQCLSQASLSHPILWSQLLEHLGLPFPSRRQQLFDCVVTFHDDRTTGNTVFPVAGAQPLHVWTEGSKFGLLFEWHIFADRLSIRLEYDPDQIPEALVRVVQGMLLLAVEHLLDPTYQYHQLIEQLNVSLAQQCGDMGMDVDEIRTIAAQHLSGVEPLVG